jgi:predicted double-glycine peptidase
MKTKKTFGQLQIEIMNAETALNSLRQAQLHGAGSAFINYVVNNEDYFKPMADQLVETINDRDEPMSFEDIKDIFDFSGFDYTEEHILACRPDSQKTINEQLAYYRE